MSSSAESSPYRRRETVSMSAAKPKGDRSAAFADLDWSPATAACDGDAGQPAAGIPATPQPLKPRTVREVMTPAPTCIAAQATVMQLVRIVHTKKFRHLLVTDDDGRLVGIVSDRDIIRCFGPGEFPDEAVLSRMRADQIMSTDVVAVGPDEAPEKCIELMLSHGINCLPVTLDSRPLGILTTADLLRLLRRMLAD